MTLWSRRSVLSTLAAAAASAAARPAASQPGYPSRPVKMIVPWPPGGITDVTGRILAQRLGVELGQPTVVENRPGAAGTIGHAVAAQAEPDGYTVLLATNSTYAMAPHLFEKLPYDSSKAFAPVGLVIRSPQVFCCNPSLPVKTFAEFLPYVRARQPDGVVFESSGPGSSSHLATELLMAMAGFRMLHVPYRGGGPAVQALVSGEVACGFVDAVVALPIAEGGKIRMLGVSTTERMPLAPDVPTIAESGVPGFESSTDVALMVPTGTPSEIVARLSSALLATLADDHVRALLIKQGAIISGGSPEQFVGYMVKENAKWGDVIRARGIRMQ
ncbi:Bug family tripartite tricarboxylate transporter substrate binding protein [Rhodoplanes azumiensis]|uniref:Bug family tripartite tricarboxylate transporter substrate binding protein n=1 Tax=Rhodoplanes azumiensis TaxID=1897628 RepID=A0ABW5AJ10_9BRAD